MTPHPYRALPDKAFWRRAVSEINIRDVDPVSILDLRIDLQTKVSTAGSCFAQHIARHLVKSGFNYYVAETGHPIFPESVRAKNNYGLFSARYGNIYTARQLLQLFKRAFGDFVPQEAVWLGVNGGYVDPFRPTVQPRGFISEAEMLADRVQHLKAVRTMFESLDVFVFTLGLTECFRSKVDGAVFPVCPGVEGGEFDSSRYEFYNQTVDEVIEDLILFSECLSKINKGAQVILTVSPVPLMATAEPGAHVLSATTYSKAVLRVAAEMVTKQFSNVHYFPSYEIITGAFNRGGYYASDLRNVLEDGVGHVMRVFMDHVARDMNQNPKRAIETAASDEYLALGQHFVEVECDEVALDRD